MITIDETGKVLTCNAPTEVTDLRPLLHDQAARPRHPAGRPRRGGRRHPVDRPRTRRLRRRPAVDGESALRLIADDGDGEIAPAGPGRRLSLVITDQNLRGLPVVVCTGRIDPGNTVRARAARAVTLIQNPAPVAKIASAIRSIL